MSVNKIKDILDYIILKKYGLFHGDAPNISKFYINKLDCGELNCFDDLICIDNTVITEGCSLNIKEITIIDNSNCNLKIINIEKTEKNCTFAITSIKLIKDERCNLNIDSFTVINNVNCTLNILTIEKIENDNINS